MGMIITMSRLRGCARWRHGEGAINLDARPACAALAAAMRGAIADFDPRPDPWPRSSGGRSRHV